MHVEDMQLTWLAYRLIESDKPWKMCNDIRSCIFFVELTPGVSRVVCTLYWSSSLNKHFSSARRSKPVPHSDATWTVKMRAAGSGGTAQTNKTAVCNEEEWIETQDGGKRRKRQKQRVCGSHRMGACGNAFPFPENARYLKSTDPSRYLSS
jgi:hypothetical protein